LCHKIDVGADVYAERLLQGGAFSPEYFDGEPQPQTAFAVRTTSSSLWRISSQVSRLPAAVEAKPHCGEIASRSSGTYLAASSMRRRSESSDSSSGSFELISPSTTIFGAGTNRSGEKSPARSVSYSSRKRSTRSWPKAFSAMAS